MDFATTIGLAIVGGLWTLALTDMGAFKRLLRIMLGGCVIGFCAGLGSLVASYYIGLFPEEAEAVFGRSAWAIGISLGVPCFMFAIIYIREGPEGLDENNKK